MYSQHDLNEITEQVILLKATAERELASIYGLTGLVYTPHRDAYMTACIKKSDIVNDLKSQGLMAASPVEIISSALDALHSRAQSGSVVEYLGEKYERRFAPLKLSKSGKSVRKWARFWLLHSADGKIDSKWQQQVHDLWPLYFVIRAAND